MRGSGGDKSGILAKLAFALARLLLGLATLAEAVEGHLAAVADVLDAFHCVKCGAEHLAVVLGWAVAPALKLECRVGSKVLASELSVRLCPADLARVAPKLEIGVALAPAEHKRLCVISHKADTSSWVHLGAAEPTRFYLHPP